MRRSMSCIVAGTLLAVATGCIRCKPLPIEQIVGDMNANSAKVTSLSGRVGVSVRAPKQVLYFSLDGRLNYGTPDRIHLLVSKLGRDQFDLGANEHEYWFWSREPIIDQESNVVRFGSVSQIARAEAQGMSFRPDAVAQALGVAPLKPAESTLVGLPEQYERLYVVNYVRETPRGPRLVRKTYIDRCTGRVTHIDYFAPDGTQTLIMTFADYQERDGVLRPMRVTLDFPAYDATLRFDLANLKLNPEIPPEGFARPPFPGARQRNLDTE